MTAPGRQELAEYWEAQGRRAGDSELEAVCCPGAPPFLNAYVAHSQRRAFARLLSRIGSLDGLRVVDVGCGTGRWSRVLRARGADVLGVDRSAAMLEVAARRSPGVRFELMDATSLDLSSDSVDLATQVTVVQHLPLPSQLRAMREMVRVVRPGGHVLSVDVVGDASDFDASHGTFPRRRKEWVELWERAGAFPEFVLGQDRGYLLAALRLGGRHTGGSDDGRRRAATGWRAAALRALVVASYASDWALSPFPALPGSHVAGLYRVH